MQWVCCGALPKVLRPRNASCVAEAKFQGFASEFFLILQQRSPKLCSGEPSGETAEAHRRDIALAEPHAKDIGSVVALRSKSLAGRAVGQSQFANGF